MKDDVDDVIATTTTTTTTTTSSSSETGYRDSSGPDSRCGNQRCPVQTVGACRRPQRTKACEFIHPTEQNE